jgi:hypothetical protein
MAYISSSTDMRIKALEDKLEYMTMLLERNTGNMEVLYKRITALAYMVECVGDKKTPVMTESLRAEVDATVAPEAFAALFQQDPEEFAKRYGKSIFEQVIKHGILSVCCFGTISSTARLDKSLLQ